MEINIDVRRKQLENLDQFISSSKDRVDSILDYLGWNADKITKNQKETVKCPVNPSHRIPTSSLNSHMQKCSWQKEKYHKDDIPLSEPNPIPGGTILIDDLTKVNVLNRALAVNPQMKTGWRSSEPEPKTSNRLLATFTPDERLALYEFAASTTKGPPQVPEFNVEPKIVEKQNLTPYELKVLERDAKRRRQKYRTKSVHMNSKSPTEILREIIDGQMELYEEWIQDKNNIIKKEHIEENVKSVKSDVKSEKSDVKHDVKPDVKSNVKSEIKEESNDKDRDRDRDRDRERDRDRDRDRDHDDKLESSNEPSSPKSSRSQNSFKSQESRHKSRRRSIERSRDRSRSRSRKRDYRKDYRHDYSSRRRYDDRHFDRDRERDRDRDRKYNYRRNSREFKSSRSEY